MILVFPPLFSRKSANALQVKASEKMNLLVNSRSHAPCPVATVSNLDQNPNLDLYRRPLYDFVLEAAGFFFASCFNRTVLAAVGFLAIVFLAAAFCFLAF